MKNEVYAPGLDGVVVGDTRCSHVDGEKGRLIVAGHDIETLAPAVDFEAVVALLGRAVSCEVEPRLGQARSRAFSALPTLSWALTRADGMDALRAALAHLSPAEDYTSDLVASVAIFAAAWWRLSRGLTPIAPDSEAGHAHDYLRMLTGQAPRPEAVAALNAYWVTVADHGMNTSTFVARVIASTGSDPVSAIVGAVGALKGPLHGGAPGPVLDMLDAIGEPQNAEPWLAARLAAGERIMGMGHRIYRVRDPRAAVLEGALARLEVDGGSDRLRLARSVEQTAERLLALRFPKRAMKANVEFYTAVLLEAIGLDRRVFSTTFAAARVAGWCAHYAEQRAQKKLIRPDARYLGPLPDGYEK